MGKTLISTLFFALVCASNFAAEKSKNFVQISGENPHYFQLTDGSTYVPIGIDLCWGRFGASPDVQLPIFEKWLEKFSSNGGNFVRVWLSASFEIEDSRPFVYSEEKLKGIDTFLAMCKKYGVRVKFCIEDFRVLVAPEGARTNEKRIYHKDYGGPLVDMQDYLTSQTGKKLFLDKMKEFSKRYADNDSVFGWELWNEMNAVRAPKPLVVEWTKEMLVAIRPMFPNHLIMQSLGSYDSSWAVDTYEQMSAMPENQVAQIHRYLDQGARIDACKGDIATLCRDSILTIQKDLKKGGVIKPILLAETGGVKWQHSGYLPEYDKDPKGVILHDILFVPFFSGAASNGHIWHWDCYVDKNNLWWHFSRFAEAIKGIDPVKERYEPFMYSKNFVNYYGLRGKNTVIIFARDMASNWYTELVDGTAPKARRESVAFRDMNFGDGEFSKVTYYLPWKNEWISGKIENGKIAIPEFERSVVIKLER